MKYRRYYRESNPGNIEYKAELRFELKAKFVKSKHEHKLSVSVKYYLDSELSQFIFNFGPDGSVESGRRSAHNTERLIQSDYFIGDWTALTARAGERALE